MAEKDSNSKQWSDPKDFGLPYVEVSPLSSLKTNSKAPDQAPSVELPQTSSLPIEDKKKESKTSRPGVASTTAVNGEKKKAKTWVWVVLILIILAVTAIIIQLKINQEVVAENENLVVDPLDTAALSKHFEDSYKLAKSNLDSLSNQDSSVNSSFELNSTSINSGTSIATNPRVKRVEQKEGSIRYYLVVGSFASEQETARHIQNLGDKFTEYYLVYPYKKNQNYRLAIGSYSTWKEASAKLKEMNAQDSTGYWILNY
jgi:hypothetical protein